MKALDFLNSRFRGSYNKKTFEFHTTCPKCSHSQFYFNTRKGLGHCKRANCHWSPTLKELISFVGSSASVDLDDSEVPKKEKVKVTLPSDATPLLSRDLTAHCIRCETTISHLEADRNISRKKQFQYNIHETENRVFVPIYFNNDLVNYVGRAKWWYLVQSDQRYKYHPGASTSDFIFNWDQMKFIKQLTLVENTFNAIWLSELGVSTNFGSSLSQNQCSLIENSNIKSVVLLWDEGSEINAEKAVNRLKNAGVRSIFIKICNQPDDHTEDCIKNMVRLGHQEAERGKLGFLNIQHPVGDCDWGQIKK